MRLIRLMRLLTASVGPLVAFEMCQLVIWGVQRAMVRPSLLISVGQDSCWRSSASWEGVLESEGGAVDVVDASHDFLRVPGCAHLAVGVTSIEKTTQAGLTAVADAFVGRGQESAYPMEWVSFPASVSEGFVGDPASYLVATLVGPSG